MTVNNVLLIGGGGREHAIAWKLCQSDHLGALYVAPGNTGTEEIAVNVDIDTSDFEQVADFCRQKNIDLIVIGPEKPLVDGLTDYLEERGFSVFGPGREAARLEGSKEFAKKFMDKYKIPTASYETFDSGRFDEVLDYIRIKNQYPVVLKADGLAAGKGVFICESEEEVTLRLRQLGSGDSPAGASDRIVVEEFMAGEEVSVFVLSDGHSANIIHHAQDHKRIGEGDTGLNTGGMGAYSPAPVMSDEMMERVNKEIILPTITGMQLEETPYKGVLYVGLMITDEGPKVVEYNCRFGDPECQVILPLLKNDLLDLMVYTIEQRLDEKELQLDRRYACCVVMASGGYPLEYEKGKEISGLDQVDDEALVFHAGTRRADDKILSSGGRVVNVVGTGGTLSDAIDHAYRNVRRISFDKATYRTDIGRKGLPY
ncbi:MAG: phosphoribosylamine--glycine ligase [Balneolaceae bacterium]